MQQEPTFNQQHYQRYKAQYINRSIHYNRTHKLQRHKTERKWRTTKQQRLHKYMGTILCPKCQTKGYLTMHSRQTVTTKHHHIHGIVMHLLHKRQYQYCYISRKSLLALLDELQIENPFSNQPTL